MKHGNLLSYLVPTYFVARHGKTSAMAIIYTLLVLNVLLTGTPK